MKMWIVFATWLCCNIAIGSSLNAPVNYPTVKFTTHLASVGSYQTLMSALRVNLESKLESHNIPLLRKPSDITDQNKYLLVELTNYDTKRTVTLALTVLNVYVIGYKSGTKSFFLKDAPSDAKTLLFTDTTPKTLEVDTNYNNLGDRSKVGLGIPALKNAINILNQFDGVSTDQDFKHSLLIVIQMVSEAARFKFIQLKIEGGLLTQYLPKPDTISYQNNWSALSKSIQLADANGRLSESVTLKYEDGKDRVVFMVEQVQRDISLLLYHVGSTERLGEEKFGGVYADEAVEDELLSVI
uniref:rRNA N-glycosylase n=1 Tax=Euphorbia serrata TaxID=196589 RepID=Q8GZP0_9ROSI|nr:ribosome inactivating protein Euserratin 1 precursor [Euphorbia serrata]